MLAVAGAAVSPGGAAASAAGAAAGAASSLTGAAGSAAGAVSASEEVHRVCYGSPPRQHLRRPFFLHAAQPATEFRALGLGATYQVIAQELHNEGAVLVALLAESVKLYLQAALG